MLQLAECWKFQEKISLFWVAKIGNSDLLLGEKIGELLATTEFVVLKRHLELLGLWGGLVWILLPRLGRGCISDAVNLPSGKTL